MARKVPSNPEQEAALPAWKRALDVAAIAALSPGLLLVGGGIALFIKLTSSGPVLFRQRRVGYRGQEFTCFKFRTMKPGVETESHRRHTRELMNSNTPMTKLDEQNDPRLIPFGALLRATGLDELPQLINVWRREMSLVGPRPCIPYETQSYQEWHWKRFDSVPGLTGLWQVSGKNKTTFEEMVHLDIEYSKRRRLALDLKIILKTFPALLTQVREARNQKRREQQNPSPDVSGSVPSFKL